VMALQTRRQFFGIETQVTTRELARGSRLVRARWRSIARYWKRCGRRTAQSLTGFFCGV